MQIQFIALVFILGSLLSSTSARANQCMAHLPFGLEELVEIFSSPNKHQSLLAIDIYFDAVISKNVGEAQISATVENGQLSGISISGNVGLMGLSEDFDHTISIDDLINGRPVDINLAYKAPPILSFKPKAGFSASGGEITLELRTSSGLKKIDFSLQQIGNRFVLMQIKPGHYQKVRKAKVGVNGLKLENIKITKYKFN